MKLTAHISSITLIFLVTLLLWWGTASANQLSNVRIAEHTNFTRIVFEFKDTPGYSNPILGNEGRVTVIFYDCSAGTKVTPQQLREETQQINSLALIQQGSDLFANITVPYSDFTTKTMYLSKPHRVVLDIYLPGMISGGKTFIMPNVEQTEMLNTVKSVTLKELPQTTRFEHAEIYLLCSQILLNIVVVIMLGILSYAFFKKRERPSMVDQRGIPDTSDKSMFLIDSKIQEEFKKYQCL